MMNAKEFAELAELIALAERHRQARDAYRNQEKMAQLDYEAAAEKVRAKLSALSLAYEDGNVERRPR